MYILIIYFHNYKLYFKYFDKKTTFIKLYVIFFILLIDITKSITLNSIAFTYYEQSQIFTPIINDFNRYSSENHLNITINLNLFTPANSTIDINDYGTMIDTLLKKRPPKYDLYFYDNAYSQKYGLYLLNLEKKLPEEHIKMYNASYVNQTCSYIGENEYKIVGLVIRILIIIKYKFLFFIFKLFYI